MDWLPILKDYVTPGLAGIGVLRPEISKFFGSLFRKGRIEIQRGSDVVLGFTNSGPTVVLSGSMVAGQRTCFLRSAEVVVERLSDKAQRRMTWAFFGSTQISGPFSTVQELPRIVRLVKDEVFTYRIGFVDNVLHEEFAGLIADTNRRFRHVVFNTRNELLNAPNLPEGVTPQIAMQEAYHQVRPNFVASEECQRVVHHIERTTFWFPGEYKIVFNGMTDNKHQDFSRTWFFTVDERDHELLYMNLGRIFAGMLDEIPISEYYVATRLLKDEGTKPQIQIESTQK